MSIKAVGWALDQDVDGLDAFAKLTLIGMAEAADRTDDCVFLGRKSLAEIALVKSVRTVDRCIDDLTRFGLIAEVDVDALSPEHLEKYRMIRGDRRPNIYRIERTGRRANAAGRSGGDSAAVGQSRGAARRADAARREPSRGAARGAARGAKRGAGAAAPEPSKNHEPYEPARSETDPANFELGTDALKEIRKRQEVSAA